MKTPFIVAICILGMGTTLFACGGVSGWAGLTPSIDPDLTMLVYDPSDGDTVLYPGRNLATTIEIRSDSSLFIPENADALVFNGLFDVATEEKLFKLDPSGMGTLQFGEVLPTGLNGTSIMEDLSIIVVCGSNQPLLHVVPEPKSLGVATLLLIALVLRRHYELASPSAVG